MEGVYRPPITASGKASWEEHGPLDQFGLPVGALLDSVIQPCPSRCPHFRAQAQQAVLLQGFHAPPVQYISQRQGAVRAPATPGAYSAGQLVQQAAQLPQAGESEIR